jgi:hypothetical protein
MSQVNWKNKADLPVSVKNRNDLADYDYLHKLNKEELSFLKAFNREYVNADFKHKGKRIFKKKKERLKCYELNNKRNSDLYSKLKWTNNLFINGIVNEDHCRNEVDKFIKEKGHPLDNLIDLDIESVNKIIRKIETNEPKKRRRIGSKRRK